MNLIFVSSFVPRKCGIATYTHDLTEALIKQGHTVGIIEPKNAVTSQVPHRLVKKRIEQNNKSDYIKAAEALNADKNVELVHIQHEYGLFGGDDGEYILEFAGTLKKPLWVTFHTVLATPNI